MKRRRFVYLTGCAVCAGCQRGQMNEQTAAKIQDTSDFTACDPPVEGVTVDLAEHPELLPIGGWKRISFPQALLHLLIVHLAPNDWIATWKYCSHGFCELDWSETEAAIQCPCHSSLFDTEGVVLVGPATENIRCYDVCEKDNTLYISSS
ncbi:MAG: Rieske (2Fe-2S) protein [Myxococcota bacterium]|nr:Rieske (2Fe-2S) protein [Myxococcota bacterium]